MFKWRNGCIALTLNQKPEKIKIREEGMSKVEISWKLCLLYQLAKLAKEKGLKEIKSAVLVNTKMTRKGDRLIAGKKVWGLDGRSSQPQHYLKLNPIQSKASPPFNFMKAEESWRRKTWDSRGWFWRFKEMSHLHSIKVQGETVSADAEAATSYPEDLGKMINQNGSNRQLIFIVVKIAFYWKIMLSSIFITREEKSMHDFKFQQTNWLSC